MTNDELFDAVAPIAIYHQADLRFQQKAKIGLRKLKAAGVQPTEAKLDDLRDWAATTYVELFQTVVESVTDGWTLYFDKWGARAYKDQHGTPVFSGDGSWEFPWYETAALLKERVLEHQGEGETA
jgi:hypothetical protein